MGRVLSQTRVLVLLVLFSGCQCDRDGDNRNDDNDRDAISDAFSVGGTLTGLASGAALVLQNNGGDDRSVKSNGSFTFFTMLDDEEGYNVTVRTHPVGQSCVVLNGKGRIHGSDIDDIEVLCTTGEAAYAVGGTLSGLTTGLSVALQNNGEDDLTLWENGPFRFSTHGDDGAAYDIAVKTQPDGQNCVVTNRSGTIQAADVTDISVVCTEAFIADVFTVGGSVTGLQGTGLILQNNGEDELEISEDGDFIFSMEIADGGTYDVTVAMQPMTPEQFCSVTNGSGTLNGSEVTSVLVTCGESPPSIGFFLAYPELVDPGESVTLGWTVQKADSCEINPGAIEAELTDDPSAKVTVNATTTFVLTCQGPGGSTASSSVTVHVVDTDWAQVSAGYESTCALKIDGRVFCWGRVNAAQIRLDYGSNSPLPLQEFSGASDWIEVTAGFGNNCGLKRDGRLYCWGNGSEGQLGNGSQWTNSDVPLQEGTAASDWDHLSMNGRPACAIKRDGRLFCWGVSATCPLGDDRLSLCLVPTQERSSAGDWAQVSAGGHVCAIKRDGRLFCWGFGTNGRLGNNSESDSWIPVQEYTAASDWAQVSTSGHSTCAVKTDGRLFCWGYGATGQLGNNSESNSWIPVQEYTAASDWAQVSANGDHTCAVKTDGRLFCWGGGGSGQLGIEKPGDSSVPEQEATAANDWAQVSAGFYHTCALKRDGRIFCWGDNGEGQLGAPELGPVWPTD